MMRGGIVCGTGTGDRDHMAHRHRSPGGLPLAEAIDVFDVLTLDRRGFSTYRAKRTHGLRLVLDLARPGERFGP